MKKLNLEKYHQWARISRLLSPFCYVKWLGTRLCINIGKIEVEWQRLWASKYVVEIATWSHPIKHALKFRSGKSQTYFRKEHFSIILEYSEFYEIDTRIFGADDKFCFIDIFLPILETVQIFEERGHTVAHDETFIFVFHNITKQNKSKLFSVYIQVFQ